MVLVFFVQELGRVDQQMMHDNYFALVDANRKGDFSSVGCKSRGISDIEPSTNAQSVCVCQINLTIAMSLFWAVASRPQRGQSVSLTKPTTCPSSSRVSWAPQITIQSHFRFPNNVSTLIFAALPVNFRVCLSVRRTAKFAGQLSCPSAPIKLRWWPWPSFSCLIR